MIDEYRKYIDMPLSELVAIADKIRRENKQDVMQTCSIVNAKSGRCSEDCKFCAQSAHHKTEVDVYKLKSKDEIITAAEKAKELGSLRFGIVTSGNTLTEEDLNTVCEAMTYITQDLGMKVCGSLGALDTEKLLRLKAAGMTKFHHNIETSAQHYTNIVSTHDFQQRLDTVKRVKDAGLEICCGGILGLGETWEDRINMALLIRDLDVDGIPLNVLVPIDGTKIVGVEAISPEDVIRTIAIFRIINPTKTIKVAAGRESRLKDYQAMAFMAGANGMLIGGYLTVRGRAHEEDAALINSVERMWQS